MYKTIIIGAGPAGLSAGRFLEDALILDKKEEIGCPVQCGEGISKKALEDEGITPEGSWISANIKNFEIIVPSGKIISLGCGEEMGYVLDRIAFEKFLASKCKANIQLKTKVIDIELKDGIYNVKTEKGDVLKAKYLIGADGPASIVRRKFFKEKVNILPTFTYLVELEKEISTSAIKMYFDRERYPNGYVWIFPKSRKTANIGLGGIGNLEEKFNEFMERIVRRDFGNYKLLKSISGTISWGGALLKVREGNILLVGDAGALIDPVFGGGISNAMTSGRVAADFILKEKPELYEAKIKSMPFCRRDLLLAQKILYSLPNSVFDQLAEIWDGRNLFCLKSIPVFLKFLSKPALRKNTGKIFKLLSILRMGAEF